jgi:hypothetical protein
VYSAARIAAARIHAHFERHPAPAVAPGLDAIEAMIEAAFWASLRREEGFMTKISLALTPPDGEGVALRFERPLQLAAQPLTRLAPAVERPGIHLGVWREGGQLQVWGATRRLPPYCLAVEVIAPGLLVVKHSRGEAEKFVNVAVLEGDEIKIIDEEAGRLPDCPGVLTSLLGFETASGSATVLVQLAISMRAHGRGGSLLVVPAGSERWRESVRHPMSYALDPPFTGLADLVARGEEGAALRRGVDGVAGLTAVDGATVISDRYEVLAFGAKIVGRGLTLVNEVVLTEPIEGFRAEATEPGQMGGTRHLSAAQFAYDQRDSVALVASVDGRFTVMAWSGCEEMVHAHRIESLLL